MWPGWQKYITKLVVFTFCLERFTGTLSSYKRWVKSRVEELWSWGNVWASKTSSLLWADLLCPSAGSGSREISSFIIWGGRFLFLKHLLPRTSTMLVHTVGKTALTSSGNDLIMGWSCSVTQLLLRDSLVPLSIWLHIAEIKITEKLILYRYFMSTMGKNTLRRLTDDIHLKNF